MLHAAIPQVLTVPTASHWSFKTTSNTISAPDNARQKMWRAQKFHNATIWHYILGIQGADLNGGGPVPTLPISAKCCLEQLFQVLTVCTSHQNNVKYNISKTETSDEHKNSTMQPFHTEFCEHWIVNNTWGHHIIIIIIHHHHTSSSSSFVLSTAALVGTPT